MYIGQTQLKMRAERNLEHETRILAHRMAAHNLGSTHMAIEAGKGV